MGSQTGNTDQPQTKAPTWRWADALIISYLAISFLLVVTWLSGAPLEENRVIGQLASTSKGWILGGVAGSVVGAFLTKPSIRAGHLAATVLLFLLLYAATYFVSGGTMTYDHRNTAVSSLKVNQPWCPGGDFVLKPGEVGHLRLNGQGTWKTNSNDRAQHGVSALDVWLIPDGWDLGVAWGAKPYFSRRYSGGDLPVHGGAKETLICFSADDYAGDTLSSSPSIVAELAKGKRQLRPPFLP